jgi:hypothetical protein
MFPWPKTDNPLEWLIGAVYSLISWLVGIVVGLFSGRGIYSMGCRRRVRCCVLVGVGRFDVSVAASSALTRMG